MANNNPLVRLAQKLASEGPYRVEQTPRRVRALFNGRYVIDTLRAYHVWEHPNFPQFYVPTSEFADADLTSTSPIDGTHGHVHFGRLAAGNAVTERILIFGTEELRDLVKVDFHSMDQWFEEDVPVYGHPKDPYKRIDILHSTRNIKVGIDGVTLADTSSPLFLLETTLRSRHYLPPTSVSWEYLRRSDTETLCPYKGRANYYHVVVNGKEHRDLVWYYRYPTSESASIAGYLCFYNEKVDVWIDGEKEQR
ncbi:uncharacterized protein EKO05_0007701 [Ascochyta rabiei]|uniref:Uncharacterized protein n=1 Tax=Didymella rabiei TaxID=5454 RepID=A0A162VFE2_DIDRA|nr:uncharacterized protein EKO05_0007701 [Ascochyta rabiei]KZM18426.1 hypothetical protein ST47_g10434 [Ascochyta rabiei]UPX17339.1 hypothetical protein EKO05_0007701 [Ascochyta rabiei]